jgi:signal transduction histidine kinase
MMPATDDSEIELAGLIHDLRNPLTAILGQAQLLRRYLDRDGDAPSAPVERTLSAILSSAHQMSAMLDAMLTCSRHRSGAWVGGDSAAIDLSDILRLALDQVEQATGQRRIHLEPASRPVVGVWEPTAVLRALVNVLENALKYSPDGGAVIVAVRQDGVEVVVTIQDQGIGIPDIDLPTLFEAFARGSNARGRFVGTGLGLISTRRLIESQGGSLELASVEGCGTTVTIRLPL